MPKGTIRKVPVNKSIFMTIVRECGSSIIKLGACEEIDCTERTIRRALNEEKITPTFLDQIARHLNVDSRLLSGDLHKQANSYTDELIRSIALAQLKVENFPYFRKRQSDLKAQPIEALWEQILALFDISFSQFEDMDFEAKYLLQHDLLDALAPVIRKHFAADAFGRTDMPNLEKVISDLENYREDYYRNLYAETVLRKRYSEKPPQGKTKEDILSMSTDALIARDI